jgi:hypothetical protein
MDLPTALSTMSKAIAGGIVTALVAELARFGFHPGDTTVSAFGVIITAVVAYVAGHLVVYFSPKNTEAK